MKSIRFKLIFIYFILVFIVMIISGSFIILSTKKQETKKVENELKSYTKYIKEQIIDEYEDPNDFQAAITDLFIQKLFLLQNIQTSIIDKNGKTIASTISNINGSFVRHKSSIVIAALNGKENFGEENKSVGQNPQVKKWISYGYPVFDAQNNVQYVIYIQTDASNIFESLSETTNTIAISVIIALVLAIVLGSLFSNTITAPISLLKRKANLLAKGNLEQHIIVKGEDEIGQLTRSFNHMARELRKTVSEMENENNKLEIVLHNMTDGVVAFDEIGNLIHANKNFYEFMEIPEEDEYKINLEYFLKKINFSKNKLKVNENTEVILNIDGKFIQTILIPYTVKNKFVDGIIVVIQDITKQKKLDDMRKEFVANVSHEIRTPITIIKSYTETLLEGAIENKEIAIDFLNTIIEASDRMQLLTDDLLELSRFDGGKINFIFKELNLYELVFNCVKQNAIMASKKNQKIVMKDPENKQMMVLADVGRLNQVLNNVISNAMKYSFENTNIEVYLQETEDYYTVCIQDHGIGISKENLSRVFERFYRVDKARSRAMGGNGLGLSIAKEIMLEHKGEIKVSSVLNKGTLMQIILPRIKNVN